MFSFFKKKPQGTIAEFSISGLHCPSCSLTIDGSLEDLPGVFSSETNYAKAHTVVEYDPDKVSKAELKAAITTAGYTVNDSLPQQ